MFAALAPAAAAAGAGLLLGLAVAAAVAFCNAASSAQYPSSGGAYVYGRERLGEWPGFLAGWCFLVGKTASCAAMALTFAAYALPGAPQRVVRMQRCWCWLPSTIWACRGRPASVGCCWRWC